MMQLYSLRRRAMSTMRAGDVVRVDFGTPARGEPGLGVQQIYRARSSSAAELQGLPEGLPIYPQGPFVRPAIVVTSDDVLEFRQHAVLVVPCTTNLRGWLTEVEIAGFGVAQAHLPTTVSVERIVEATETNVGAVVLRQIRELVADLLGL